MAQGSVAASGFRKSSGTKASHNRSWFNENVIASVLETGKEACKVTLSNGQTFPVASSAMALFQKLTGTYTPAATPARRSR
jgi:competence transcription factor ComK